MKDPNKSRSRVILGGAIVSVIIALRLIFVADPAIGMLITYTAVLGFFAYLWRMVNALSASRSSASSDPDPKQDFDPRTVEAAKRRAEGIE